MPKFDRAEVFSSVMFGSLVMLALAVACLYARNYGGPAWLAGQESAVFIKLALLTVGLVVIDICWRSAASRPATVSLQPDNS